MSGNAEKSRARIIHASRHLFGQRGYGATSLREIAADAGVTKPMVYYYFGSKEGLYRTLVDETFADFRLALDAAAQPGDGRSARERLENLARVHFELAHARADALRLMVCGSRSAHDGPATDAHRALEGVHRRVIERIVDDGLGSGELRGSAELLMIAIRSLMISFHSPLGPAIPADSESPERLVALLYGGIAASPAV